MVRRCDSRASTRTPTRRSRRICKHRTYLGRLVAVAECKDRHLFFSTHRHIEGIQAYGGTGGFWRQRTEQKGPQASSRPAGRRELTDNWTTSQCAAAGSREKERKRRGTEAGGRRKDERRDGKRLALLAEGELLGALSHGHSPREQDK